MADQDTTVNTLNGEDVNEEVETLQGEDETKLNEQPKEEGTELENEEGEEELDEDGNPKPKEGETKAEFKKRFTQFEGETLEEYLSKVEEAYANSSTEGQRNAKRASDAEVQAAKVAQFIATNPDFAEAFNKATGTDAPAAQVDPALEWAKEEMNKVYASDYKSFTDLHPEMLTDETLREEVIQELDIIGAAWEKRGKKLSMADGLKKAWISLGYDATDNKEDIVNKTKEQASTPSPQAKKTTTVGKQEFTQDQIDVAKKMGLTPEQLAKYSKK